MANTLEPEASEDHQRHLETGRLMDEMHRLNQELEQQAVVRTAELKASNARLLESQAELRTLSHRLMRVTEQERTRISREIHDQLGQALTVIRMDILMVRRRLTSDQADQAGILAKLEDVSGLVDEMIQAVRRIAADMRPGILDDFGLEAAVQWQLEEFEKHSGLRCRLQTHLDAGRLDSELVTASFRILQEALTNVARHSGATEVRVTLKTDADFFTMLIHDNGRGISYDEQRRSGSLGIVGMRERAIQFGGSLKFAGSLQGLPSHGTTVTLTVPLGTPEEESEFSR